MQNGELLQNSEAESRRAVISVLNSNRLRDMHQFKEMNCYVFTNLFYILKLKLEEVILFLD
ncbi:hypothetical protein BH23BAC3_BH23BAC3_10930 [soil metagenome]